MWRVNPEKMGERTKFVYKRQAQSIFFTLPPLPHTLTPTPASAGFVIGLYVKHQ